MEKYKTTSLSKLESLEAILRQGEHYGLDFKELIQKIDRVKSSLSDSRIRIVLLSSFSEGKTTTVAGLIGRIESNMKIDNDESSDEIVVYRPNGKADDFEFVDTPGLFGKKEKEIDGKNVRFSEITEKYLSEAQIILYVCDAVNSIKESHAFVIEKLIRKFHKLESIIFVINKMDDAGIDLADPNDFARGAQIKKASLVQRLKDTINLTPEEEAKLNIVCIAANPGGEGIDKWLKSPEEYKEYSHIEMLRDKVDSVISASDKCQLQTATTNASLVDITTSVSAEIQTLAESLAESLTIAKDASKNMAIDLDLLKKDLTQNQKEMTVRLKELKKQLIADIDDASIETISSVLEDEIGVEGKDITFYVFNRNVNQIIKECSEANDISINTRAENINNQASIQEQAMEKAAGVVSGALKNVNISGETVKSIRNVLAKDYKFRPWGAIKLGEKATKVLKGVGKGLAVLTEAVKWYKDARNQKRLEETKDLLKEEVNKMIAGIYKTFDNDSAYYENFAPSFLQLQSETQKRNEDLQRLQGKAKALKEYSQILTRWELENAREAVIINKQ